MGSALRAADSIAQVGVPLRVPLRIEAERPEVEELHGVRPHHQAARGHHDLLVVLERDPLADPVDRAEVFQHVGHQRPERGHGQPGENQHETSECDCGNRARSAVAARSRIACMHERDSTPRRSYFAAQRA
jgi:hypothetical protein